MYTASSYKHNFIRAHSTSHTSLITTSIILHGRFEISNPHAIFQFCLMHVWSIRFKLKKEGFGVEKLITRETNRGHPLTNIYIRYNIPTIKNPMIPFQESLARVHIVLGTSKHGWSNSSNDKHTYFILSQRCNQELLKIDKCAVCLEVTIRG